MQSAPAKVGNGSGKNYFVLDDVALGGIKFQSLHWSVIEIFVVLAQTCVLASTLLTVAFYDFVFPYPVCFICSLVAISKACLSALTRWSIIESLWSGPGVRRRRSVPIGTVG